MGNTRVVINRNKTASGNADIVYYADYYPLGMELRSGGVENRYGYQGLYAEKDKETGWKNFELRNYDAAIGRWLTTDPYGQYDSPYVGMGNNPVGTVDVDGGKGTDWYLPKGSKLGSSMVWFEGSEEREGYWRIPSLQEVLVNRTVLSPGQKISDTESYRREHQFYLRQNFANPDYNDISRASTSFAIVASVGETAIGELAAAKVSQFYNYFKSARTQTQVLNESFSITNFGWKGYPAGGIRPKGPFRLLEGEEYNMARTLADKTNRELRRAHPSLLKGLEIHEIHPVKYGGSPTDLSNKIFLPRSEHSKYSTFWYKMMKDIK